MAYESNCPEDYCSVCCRRPHKANSEYCSEECRDNADKYRRRFDRTFKALRALGWGCSWEAGILARIELPHHIAFAFPHECGVIYFSPITDDLKTVNSKDLFQVIAEVITEPLTAGVQEAIRKTGYKPAEPTEFIKDLTRVIQQKNENTFTCVQCHKMWIKSTCSHPVPMDICSDCLVGKEPF